MPSMNMPTVTKIAVNGDKKTVTFSRNYQENRETIQIEEVTDSMGNDVPKSAVELIQQSLVDDGSFWLDKGEFDLSL